MGHIVKDRQRGELNQIDFNPRIIKWLQCAEYRFAPNWLGRLDFEQINLKFQGEKRRADLWTLGLLYRF